MLHWKFHGDLTVKNFENWPLFVEVMSGIM